jgi:hypothetical protein
MRVVIDSAGGVFLREHQRAITRETWIGELSSTPLQQIIDPQRVGEPEEANSDATAI